MRPPSPACLAACLIATTLSACRAPARPDGLVAGAVVREEQRIERQRRAQAAQLLSTALASAGMELTEIIAIEPPAGVVRGPLVVTEQPRVKEPTEVPPAPPASTTPPSWVSLMPKESRWPHKSWSTWDQDVAGSGLESRDSFSGDEGRASSRPPLRLNLMRLRINGHPLSLSSSLKGKGVQFKATLKM